MPCSSGNQILSETFNLLIVFPEKPFASDILIDLWTILDAFGSLSVVEGIDRFLEKQIISGVYFIEKTS
jgi:hypothetical protein